MTAITFPTREQSTDFNPEVWRCDDCSCFHVLAGKTLLTFTQEEFAAFTEKVAECYCVQSQPNAVPFRPSV